MIVNGVLAMIIAIFLLLGIAILIRIVASYLGIGNIIITGIKFMANKFYKIARKIANIQN